RRATRLTKMTVRAACRPQCPDMRFSWQAPSGGKGLQRRPKYGLRTYPDVGHTAPPVKVVNFCMLCIHAKSMPAFVGSTKKGPKPLGYLFVCIKFQILAIVFCLNAFLRLIAETTVLLQLDTSVPPFSGERYVTFPGL